MGKLSADVCEKAFLKLKGNTQKIVDFVLFGKDAAEDENPDEYLEQYQLEQLIINYIPNKAVSASVVIAVVFIVFGGRL